MSWSFSLGLVAAFSEANCLDTEPSVQSNTTPTPDQFYWPDKPTEHSRLSRFGMTCAPLMGDRGGELLTWFQAGFPVRTLVLPVAEMALTESEADSGTKWRELLARYDPHTHSLKTAQRSLLEDSQEFCATLPRWGLMRDGECWELPMWERRTKETDSGYLPTPVSIDAGSGRFNTSPGSTNRRPTLALMARKNLWPTPNAMPATSDLHFQCSVDGRTKPNKLGWAVAQTFRTPNASDGAKWSHQSQAEREAKGQQVRLGHQLGAGGKLNPNWVEWLMGWRIGHTDLKPLVTAKSHSAEQRPGACLAENSK